MRVGSGDISDESTNIDLYLYFMWVVGSEEISVSKGNRTVISYYNCLEAVLVRGAHNMFLEGIRMFVLELSSVPTLSWGCDIWKL